MWSRTNSSLLPLPTLTPSPTPKGRQRSTIPSYQYHTILYLLALRSGLLSLFPLLPLRLCLQPLLVHLPGGGGLAAPVPGPPISHAPGTTAAAAAAAAAAGRGFVLLLFLLLVLVEVDVDLRFLVNTSYVIISELVEEARERKQTTAPSSGVSQRFSAQDVRYVDARWAQAATTTGSWYRV